MKSTINYKNRRNGVSQSIPCPPNNPQLPKDNWSVNVISYVWISFKVLWIQEFERKNTNERKICKNHAEASSKYEDIINNLSASNKEFIENFKNEMYIIEAKAQDWLYLQGYKDCIKLLKLIEVL